MYLPEHFQAADRALALAVRRAPSFATLVRVDDASTPNQQALAGRLACLGL